MTKQLKKIRRFDVLNIYDVYNKLDELVISNNNLLKRLEAIEDEHKTKYQHEL